jgi:hypothetical protein
MSELLTADRLRELLEYSPETGIFLWRVKPVRRICAGQVAGCDTGNGYRIIGIDGCYFLAHRLAWLYVTGSWPTKEIDHRNTIRSDNRWNNLREASTRQNFANKGPRRGSKSGLKGAIFERRSQRWIAKIVIEGKLNCLGTFKTPEEAHAAYMSAATRHYGEFARATHHDNRPTPEDVR